MAISIEDTSVQRTSYAGAGSVTLSAGDRLRIRANPGQGDIFEPVIVPLGKVWNVNISVSIVESDA